MSRGLGRIERAVLQHLPEAPEHVDSVIVALLVFGIALPADRSGLHYVHRRLNSAQRTTVRRALASLKRKGLVEEAVLDWGWQRGWRCRRRHWRRVP